MASVSYSLNFGADQSPDEIAVGANAPGAGNVELRITSTATGADAQEIILILQAFQRRLEDGRLVAQDLGTI